MFRKILHKILPPLPKPDPDVSDFIRQGFELQEAGNTQAAEEYYRKALEVASGDPEAIYLLGEIWFSRKNIEATKKLLTTANLADIKDASLCESIGSLCIRLESWSEGRGAFEQLSRLQPGSAMASYGLGRCLSALGLAQDAERSFRRALELNTSLPQASFSLGILLREKGQDADAVAYFSQVLQAHPDHRPSRLNLADIYFNQRNWARALTEYQQILGLHSNDEEALAGKADCLIRLRRYRDGADAYKRLLLINPLLIDAYVRLARCYFEEKKLEAAEQALRKALEVAPDHPAAAQDMGNLLVQMGRLEDAEKWLSRANQLSPGIPGILTSLGRLYLEQSAPEAALQCIEQALSIAPDFAPARWNRGLLHLQAGRYQDGWEDYEWRWKLDNFTSRQREFAQAEWDGSPLSTGRLLVHAEQGFGDTIQFSRLLALAADRCQTVFFLCAPPLAPLLKNLADTRVVVVQEGMPLPVFDRHIPLISLARLFGIRVDNVPAQTPYFQVPESVAAIWQKRRKNLPGHHIGLVWAGSDNNTDNRGRSCSLIDFIPLLQSSGCHFYSLQMGPSMSQIGELPPELHIEDWAPHIRDFMDTAGAISQLDLVISVDTAVAHLAGALNKPTWIMLRRAADWRWLRTRSDSPWYPSARLFRQETANDWQAVIKEITDSLKNFAV